MHVKFNFCKCGIKSGRLEMRDAPPKNRTILPDGGRLVTLLMLYQPHSFHLSFPVYNVFVYPSPIHFAPSPFHFVSYIPQTILTLLLLLHPSVSANSCPCLSSSSHPTIHFSASPKALHSF